LSLSNYFGAETEMLEAIGGRRHVETASSRFKDTGNLNLEPV
jgi:hypothetical protein